MAAPAPTTAVERWNTTTNILNNLSAEMANCRAQDRDRIELAVAAQEEQVLETPAPHLRGVLQKLNLLFDLDLSKPDQDGDIKRLIVDDLAALIGA